jgi:hypothetical protein
MKENPGLSAALGKLLKSFPNIEGAVLTGLGPERAGGRTFSRAGVNLSNREVCGLAVYAMRASVENLIDVAPDGKVRVLTLLCVIADEIAALIASGGTD